LAQGPTREQQEESLRQAHAAAAVGDSRGMIVALFKSLAPDGVARRIKRNWPVLPDDDVDYLVSVAIDTFYRYVSEGREVERVVGFLMKVADLETNKVHGIRPYGYHKDKRDPGAFGDTDRNYLEDREAEAEREKRLRRAVARVRNLISKACHGGVRDVMEVVFDAVERGVEYDLTSSDIANAIGDGRSPGTVRSQKRRGFERLFDAAKEEGLDLDIGVILAEQEADGDPAYEEQDGDEDTV